MVVLPDEWSQPSGVTFTAGKDNGFNTNTFTTTQWQQMESSGALFLPCTGYRDGTIIDLIYWYGMYWSTTHHDNSQAYSIGFGTDGSSDTYVNFNGNSMRYFGTSVRLVKD